MRANFFTSARVKKMMGKTLLVALVGIMAAPTPLFAAKRIHDPQFETAIEINRPAAATNMEFTARESTAKETGNPRLSINERVKAILQATPPYEEKADYVVVQPTRYVGDPSIIGTPLASQEQCVKYLLSVNPEPDIAVSPEELVAYYYEEGRREGIRPDVAFAQALKETGFFRYGGTVTADQNNYCGLGTTSATIKGAYFTTPRMGVRAHIQHLLAYASTRRPQTTLVDPRYKLVRNQYGVKTLSRWVDLNGRWAVPGHTYGQSIMSMFRSILKE